MVRLDDILAKSMVEEVGIDATLRILDKANEEYVSKNPHVRFNVQYVRLAGAASIYEREREGTEDGTKGEGTETR